MHPSYDLSELRQYSDAVCEFFNKNARSSDEQVTQGLNKIFEGKDKDYIVVALNTPSSKRLLPIIHAAIPYPGSAADTAYQETMDDLTLTPKAFGHLKIIMNMGASPYTKMSGGRTALEQIEIWRGGGDEREEMNKFFKENSPDQNLVEKELANRPLTSAEIKEAFFEAVKENNVAKVQELVGRGVSVDEVGSRNKRAIHYAAENGHREMVNFLILSKADINVVDRDEGTPLHYVTRNNNITMAEQLLDAGAKIDAVSEYHTTALQMAAAKNHYNMVNFLMARGADTSIRNAIGTAHDYAVRNRCTESASLLSNSRVENSASITAKSVARLSSNYLGKDNQI